MKTSVQKYNQEIINKADYVYESKQVDPVRIITRHNRDLEKLRQKREMEKSSQNIFSSIQKKNKKAVKKEEEP